MADFPKVGTPGVYDIASVEPYVHSLAEEEQQHAMVMLLNLTHLNAYTNEYAAAVALVDHVEGLEAQAIANPERDQLTQNRKRYLLTMWREMAGRDAAMLVAHYEETLSAIRGEMKNVATIRAEVLHDRLRNADRVLWQAFPKLNKVRNAFAHRSEYTATLETAKKHAVEGRRLTFGHMEGRIYTVTSWGEDRQVSLTNESWRKLADITVEVFAAFPQLDGMLPPVA